MPDRSQMADLLKDDYPYLAALTSDELEGELNRLTGCEVTPIMANGQAFDIWRQAFAAQGKPHIWPHGPEAVAALKAKAAAITLDPVALQARLDAYLAEAQKKLPKPKKIE